MPKCMSLDFRAFVSLAALVTGLACSDAPPGGSGCDENAQCGSGEICLAAACVKVCAADRDCGAGQICDANTCSTGARTDAPVILSVDGDGAADGTFGHTASHLRRRLTLTGEHFEGADVTLHDGSESIRLEVCLATATTLTVELPDDAGAGDHLLTVATQAGSCDATLPILQGEEGPQGIQGEPGVPCSGCVDADSIEDGAVGSSKIASDSISGPHILDASIDGSKITDGGIDNVDLAADAVDGSKIADGAITGADIATSTTISAAGFVLSAPVTRTRWLDAASLTPTRGTDASSYRLYRAITDGARIVVDAAVADTTFATFATPTTGAYAVANHGSMGLFTDSNRDLTFVLPLSFEVGERLTGLECFILDTRNDARVQLWIEQQALLADTLPQIAGPVLHSSITGFTSTWQEIEVSLNITIAADTAYRLRGEINLEADQAQSVGFRGCRLTYETTRP